MKHTDDLSLAQAVVSKLRSCGHFLYHRTGGKTGRRRILRILSEHPDMLQKDLQERLKIQAGSLSEVVIKLESDGLVQKVRSQTDGRKWALKLTEKGLEEAQQLNAEYDNMIQKMMSCFTPEQLEALYEQLDFMLEHWNEAAP